MRGLALFLTITLATSFAAASTLTKFTSEELRTKATSVVVAKVAGIQYQNYNGRVWTIVTLHIERSLKGNSSGTIHFRIPGGMQSIDGRTLVTRVDGVPVIQTRERGVFFLEAIPPSYAGLLGWNQGFYHLMIKNGEDYVVRYEGSEEPVKLKHFINDFQKGSHK